MNPFVKVTAWPTKVWAAAPASAIWPSVSAATSLVTVSAAGG